MKVEPSSTARCEFSPAEVYILLEDNCSILLPVIVAFFCSCPTDSTVKFYNATGTKRRFSIQAFRFLGNTTTLYVHCYVFLCHNESTVSKCQSGCPGNRVRVRRNLGNDSEVSRDDTAHSKYYPLGIGPIVLQKDKPTEPGDKGKEWNSFSSLAFLGSLICWHWW